MKEQAFLLHALSPLHAGTGHSAGVIDLPIARMKATGIPLVPGSSIKGILRDVRRPNNTALCVEKHKWLATFGPETGDAGEHAGALVVGDARLLALPVRSFRGTFAWVTSPLLLTLAQRDLGAGLAIPTRDGRWALVTTPSVCVHNHADSDHLYLQDIDIGAARSEDVDAWAQYLSGHASPGADIIFTSRFAVVDDETMGFLWETATQIDARVRIDEAKRTVAKGALWQEESLPPETLLIGLMFADRSRRASAELKDINWGKAEEVLSFALPNEDVLQFGGKATVGRGRCRIVPLPAANGVGDG